MNRVDYILPAKLPIHPIYTKHSNHLERVYKAYHPSLKLGLAIETLRGNVPAAKKKCNRNPNTQLYILNPSQSTEKVATPCAMYAPHTKYPNKAFVPCVVKAYILTEKKKKRKSNY